MKNRILIMLAMILLAVTSCTQGPGQGNLGTDVGNPLPDETDVLLPVKSYTGFCFVFELAPEMKWEEVSDTEVNISDGELVIDLSFADVMKRYSDFVINTPDAMDLADKTVLLNYTGPGFAYDDSMDLPTAFMDVGDDREVAHLNSDARTLVSMKGDKAFIESIVVGLDTSGERCSVFADEDGADGDDGGRKIVPAIAPGDIQRPIDPSDGFDGFHKDDNPVQMDFDNPVGTPLRKEAPPSGAEGVD